MDEKDCSSEVSQSSEAEANVAKEKATAENHGEDTKTAVSLINMLITVIKL